MKRILYMFGILLLVAVFVLGMAGCKVPSVKTTGGGWFIDDCTGHKVTFGFTAIPTGEDLDAKGQFQLIDHFTKPPTRIHGMFDKMKKVSMVGDTTEFEGKCSIDGEWEFTLKIWFTDKGEPGADSGDEIKIKIEGWRPENSRCCCYDYKGTLEGGNIQVHVPKK